MALNFPIAASKCYRGQEAKAPRNGHVSVGNQLRECILPAGHSRTTESDSACHSNIITHPCVFSRDCGGTCIVAARPPRSANSVQISSLTAMRRMAPHTAATSSGCPAAAAVEFSRCRMLNMASSAPALAIVRPFWNALSCRRSVLSRRQDTLPFDPSFTVLGPYTCMQSVKMRIAARQAITEQEDRGKGSHCADISQQHFSPGG